MIKLWPRLSFLFILAVSFITLSCGSVTTPKAGLNIVASVSQQTADSITFRIGVENTGAKSSTLSFGSAQFFDIEVLDRGGKLVWRFSNNTYFAAMCWELEVAPGESHVREYIWNLMGNNQKLLPSGSYKATIHITGSPWGEGLSTVISLTI